MAYESDDISNSTSVNYAQAQALLSSISSDIATFSGSIKKAGSDSNYNGLADAGLDCGFINEFDSNIDSLTSSLETVSTSLSSAIEKLATAEDLISEGMPDVPPDELDESETPGDVNDNPENTVGTENLEEQNVGETEEEQLENPGEGVNEEKLEEQQGGKTEEQQLETPGEGENEQKLEEQPGGETEEQQSETPGEGENEQKLEEQPGGETEEQQLETPGEDDKKPTIQKPTGDTPQEFTFDASVFSGIDAASLTNILGQIIELKNSENTSLNKLFTNKGYADKIKQIVLSQPGMASDLKEKYNSMDSVTLQECFYKAVNTAGLDTFISLGYDKETATIMIDFINSNYVIE